MPDLNAIAGRFTGLFRALGRLPCRAHDPDVVVWGGTPANRPWPAEDATGGAGWTDDAARAACIGETIERWQTHPLPTDRLVDASFARWIDEGAIDPRRFVRFHPEQHASPGFPYEPIDEHTELRWIACRALSTGGPCWAPADLVLLDRRPGANSRFGPAISTGWSAHINMAAAVESALLEIIERDAMVGAWWGHYPLIEIPGSSVFGMLGTEITARLQRQNLQWRWYRVVTPFARHVTIATVSGEDREGWVFSIGSACRRERRASFEKAAIEAVQGRHYVRYLLGAGTGLDVATPTSFAEHAVFYSRHQARLASTVLAHADRERADTSTTESLPELIARLPPVSFRIATPPALVDHGYVVARVIVPELQPLHGDHRLPFLGGPVWGRRVSAWSEMPPHPFA